MKVANKIIIDNYKNEKKENKTRFSRLNAFLLQICYRVNILVLKKLLFKLMKFFLRKQKMKIFKGYKIINMNLKKKNN